MIGKPIFSRVFSTRVPSAMRGYRLSGIGALVVTQATSLRTIAVRIAATGAGFDGSAHGAFAIGFVDVANPPGPPQFDTLAK